MASGLSEEKVQQLAEKLQEKFLQKHSDDSNFDPRDVTRIRESLSWVSKFVRHQQGNFDNAHNHLMECLKWRKTFGINDIRLSDIDEALWRSGMANKRGVDRQGNHIVVLTIRMHRKDSKKAAMLRKWVAFSYETHQRLYPDSKMCMVFDMAGAGISNMDMDLMRFIVNSFKIYFPDLLAWLLVFNMPWVLQAAWKIIQTWLSQSAASKVKFVTNETIQTYIHPDQLLKRFGGNDPWQYDFDTEMQNYELELAKLWPDEMNTPNEHPRNGFIPGTEDSISPTPSMEDPNTSAQDPNTSAQDPNASAQDPTLSSIMSTGHNSDSEAIEVESGEEGEAKGGGRGRKVRFEASLPPSHQTRFGDDSDEDEEGRRRRAGYYSLDQQVLLKGSACDRGFRRRQVNKIMRSQGHPDRVHEEASAVGGEPLHWRHTFNHLKISPSHELVFAGKQDSEILCSLTLTNTSDNTLAYKVKTTAPARYKVRPNLALIDAKSVAKVHVLLVPGDSSTSVSQDKFLIQTYVFDSSATIPEQSQLSAFWKSLPLRSITEHRMRCRLLNNVPKRRSPPKHSTPKELPGSTPNSRGDKKITPSSVTFVPAPPVAVAEAQLTRQMHLMEGKVDKLVASSTQLSLRVQTLTRLNYVIFILLLLVLFFTFIY